MDRNSALPKLFILVQLTEFRKIDILEGPNCEPNVLCCNCSSAHEGCGFLSWIERICNLILSAYATICFQRLHHLVCHLSGADDYKVQGLVFIGKVG